MKKETIIERFDFEFEVLYDHQADYLSNECSKKVKDFLFDTIKEVILELVGEEEKEDLINVCTATQVRELELKHQRNLKRQEFLDKAREEGLI